MGNSSSGNWIGTPLSRRSFMHTALAGATVAASGALAGSLSGCTAADELLSTVGGSDTGDTAVKMVSNTTRFADFRPYVYEELPKVEAAALEPQLSNVVNLDQFTNRDYYYNVTELSDDAISKLEEQAFAVSDAESWAEFFGVYESNRYSFAPSFVTTDSALHTFHLMFNHVLTTLEEEHLFAALSTFSQQMVDASLEQYTQLTGSDFENAAVRNIAFFSVAASILAGSLVIPAGAPAEVEQLVTQELNFGAAADLIIRRATI